MFNFKEEIKSNNKLTVESFVNNKISYTIDLKRLTCACKDWQDTRRNYPLKDPRRLCKHLIHGLDVNNLPLPIFKFKDYIKFYQEKGWGFKRDFDEIIELNNITLLGNIGWIDVFDQNGTRYGVKKENFSNTIYWANDLKPEEYEIVEKYLIEEAKKIPLFLEKEEYPQIINFIKEVLPQKKNFYITIDYPDFYVPTPAGLIYFITESKLTPEQQKFLQQELLQKYDEEETYIRLSKASSTPSGEENEFDMEPITVTNHEIIIKMDSGKKYIYKRNFLRAKQLKESRESIEQEKKRLWQEDIKRYEKLKQKKLEKDRKIAKEKGYLLSKDHDELFGLQNAYYYDTLPLSWDEYESIKNSVLNKYATIKDLIKIKSLDITTLKFNRMLKKLEFITKESILNQNEWILKGNGLDFGINLIRMSKYMHKKIPKWYKVYMFDNSKMDLKCQEKTTNIYMTTILYKKDKFDELYEIVSNLIALEEKRHPKKIKKSDNRKEERERWLRNIECPHCASKNLHKKNTRNYKYGAVQRYLCVDCKRIFQVKIDEKDKSSLV